MDMNKNIMSNVEKTEDFDEMDSIIRKALIYYYENKEDDDITLCESKNVEFSRRYKVRMNRIFREILGAKHALNPEVDNGYERVRSYCVVMFKKIKCRICEKLSFFNDLLRSMFH